jgi:hypothetical protein
MRTRGVFILNTDSDVRRRSASKAFRTNNLWLRKLTRFLFVLSVVASALTAVAEDGTKPVQVFLLAGLKLTDLAGTIPVSAQVDSHWTVRAERGIARDKQVIDESAPLFHVRKDAAPMIVFVADNDLKGRADMNRQFFAAMQKAGNKGVSFHEIAGRNHGSIMNRVLWPGDEVAKRMSDFVRQHRSK